MVIGPNSGTGHASLVFAIETQVNLITQLIRPILHHEISAISIKRDVCIAYNEMIQPRTRENHLHTVHELLPIQYV